MQQRITWTSDYYHSTEHLILGTEAGKHIATSSITGSCNEKPFHLNYTLSIDDNWELMLAKIIIRHNNSIEQIDLSKAGNRWSVNGSLTDYSEDIFDIDISATPFTNTLPINRLKLAEGERRVIEVVYIDVFEQQLTTMKQVYTRLAANKYLYENFDGSFEAEILVDDNGLVVEYPGLFTMNKNVTMQP